MGKIIVFEGIDGSGKTTQLYRVLNYLKLKNKKVIAFKEPGTTELGEELRNILLHKKVPVSKRSETLLFLAARSQLIVEKIKPYLDDDYIILLDRFSLSTYVYQGKISVKDLETVKIIDTFATYGIKPDLTLLYKIDYNTYKQRVGVKDKLEAKYEKYIDKLIYYYDKLGKKCNAITIDGTQSIPEVFIKTKQHITKIVEDCCNINIEEVKK